MFDLPDPFGPTITLTPGEKTSFVRSGNDLKPLMVIELRCMANGTQAPREHGRLAGASDARFSHFGAAGRARRCRASAAAACSAAFLLRPSPWPMHVAVDLRRHLELAGMRRTGLLGDGVGYAGAVAGKGLLEGGLEVEQLVGRHVHLVDERGNRGGGGLLEAVVQVAGADHSLRHRGESPLRGQERINVDAAIHLLRSDAAEALGKAQLGRDVRARTTAHGLPMDLREAPDVGAGEPLE